MTITKTCSTCEHFPNDHHCVGCVWDQGKGENTKWELKTNPIVIERKVLDKIRAEIDVARFIDKDTKLCKNANASGLEMAMQIIDKYTGVRE